MRVYINSDRSKVMTIDDQGQVGFFDLLSTAAGELRPVEKDEVVKTVKITRTKRKSGPLPGNWKGGRKSSVKDWDAVNDYYKDHTALETANKFGISVATIYNHVHHETNTKPRKKQPTDEELDKRALEMNEGRGIQRFRCTSGHKFSMRKSEIEPLPDGEKRKCIVPHCFAEALPE